MSLPMLLSSRSPSQASTCDKALLAEILRESSFTLNGRTLPADYDLGALTDTTLRLRLIGLPGGMPGSRGDSEFAGLAKKALMDRAKELGVPTRTGQGKARTWRSMIRRTTGLRTKYRGAIELFPGSARCIEFLPVSAGSTSQFCKP